MPLADEQKTQRFAVAVEEFRAGRWIRRENRRCGGDAQHNLQRDECAEGGKNQNERGLFHGRLFSRAIVPSPKRSGRYMASALVAAAVDSPAMRTRAKYWKV